MIDIQPWHFYNLAIDIDEEQPLVSSKVPAVEFSKTTFFKLIQPLGAWRAFSPADNARLCARRNQQQPSDQQAGVSVGRDRLLYRVIGSTLEPIYWPKSLSTGNVVCARWVFARTLTPVNPEWQDLVTEAYETTKPWTKHYQEVLESAIKEPSALELVITRIDLPQGALNLSVCLAFVPNAKTVHVFSSGRFKLEGLAECLLAGTTPDQATESFCEFEWPKWKALHSLGGRPNDDPGYEPQQVNRLLLVFHGIGQKLSESIESVNFTYAIERLRVQMNKTMQSPDVACHLQPNTNFLVLPVNWRQVLNMNRDEKFTVESITMPTVPAVRRLVTDVLMDVPYYLSNHRGAMLSAAAGEANRLYKKVCEHHPDFHQQGEVSLIGHSLGSLIVSDLLSDQPSQCTKDSPFTFNTRNLFTTGSPLAFFLHMRGLQLVPRSLSTRRQFGCMAVRSIYNVMHHSDVLCFQLNPTVCGDPVPIKRAADLSVKPKKLWGLFSKQLSCEFVNRTTKELQLLNDYGQLDWVIPLGSNALENQYVRILTAHFDYWAHPEVARLLVIECGRIPGSEHAVDEYRVRPEQLL